MNKNAIQKFAIWARNELIDQVKQRAFQYGISDKGYGEENAEVIAGRVLSKEEKQQRHSFVIQIKEHGYQLAVEEVAYTWFNRFVALRFMEVNDYLPTHVRVFSDANGDFNPEILKEVLHLDLPRLDKAKVSELLNGNKTEELYRYLLLTQCNALNNALPEMFERLGSYTEMLLPNNILKLDGVLGRLVTDISEEDWRDAVQIIGWMYQYYNTEPKQAVFDGLKKNVKISKEKIPAATQLFTPDWIVRYMVENSLGRLWLESHPNDALKANWKYYLDDAEQTPEVAERLRVLRSQSPVKSPEDIRLIDPCMGSGHILVYAFDVLMQIYVSEGYNPRDAAKPILEKNLHGLDIDRRAYQLAYFSLMMKARQYNRRILTENVNPQVYHPAGFPDGEEYGSLVKVDVLPPMPVEPKEITLFTEKYETTLNTWNFKRLLAQKYDVVVTNPPYMGSSGMSTKMLDFVKKTYPDSKSDLFATFIEQCICLASDSGAISLVTMHSWMFLSSFEKMRKKMLHSLLFETINHLGMEAFDGIIGKVVSTAAFTAKKCEPLKAYKGEAVRLTDYYDALRWTKEHEFFSAKNHYRFCQVNFEKIPGSPVAYWVSEKALTAFSYPTMNDVAEPRHGLATSNNDLFLKLWHEVSIGRSSIFDLAHPENYKWIPINKGGRFRKWFGNNEWVINFENDGKEIKKYAADIYVSASRTIQNTKYYFQKSLTWSALTSGTFSVRSSDIGYIFGSGGYCAFVTHEMEKYILALMNNVVSRLFVSAVSPTLNYEVGHIKTIPVIKDENKKVAIDGLVAENISLSRADWDSFETSWDFKRHPLICGEHTVAAAFAEWEREAAERFDTLKANEEELNRIFIDIYDLQDELTPEVEDKDVTVRRADLGRDIRSLISYAVGCMFGRYSLNMEGLAYAGGNWDAGKYRTFIPDKDNILPICDDEYFDDDIVGRFVEFIKTVYGADTLEENLKFIADAIGGKGTPREVIRNYFLNDFYADHCKIYQKRPIYWLFDSGKKNGFKALVYLHRYSRDLLAKLRTDYVHEQQERYRTQLTHIDVALNTASGSERARLLKQHNKLVDQSREIGAYEEKVHHLADRNIDFDLDEGVKKNYQVFTDVLAKI